MKAGFVQINPLFGDVEANIRAAIRIIETMDADLIVLPELFNTGYLFTSKHEAEVLAEPIPGGKTTQALCGIARQKNVHIVGGVAEKESDRCYNSAVLVSPEGYRATYRKVHLFNEENLWFAPGEGGFEVYDIGVCKLGIMICFDWFFPESMRILALKGADVICHPANLVLPYCQDAMITRCLENRVFAVTANRTGMEQRGGKAFHYTGRSQIAGPMANLLCRAGSDRDEAGIAEIDVELARNKQLNQFNNLFNDRRVSFYGELIEKVNDAALKG